MRTARDYLQDMLDRIGRLEQIVADGKATFERSFMHQDSIIRNYEVIGEIAKRLPETLLQTAPQVKWNTLKGFRDFLAHNYEKVDLTIVWEAVEDLPELREAVQKMLDALPDEETNKDTPR
jgi:uncharacterized protein with HEPN domain